MTEMKKARGRTIALHLIKGITFLLILALLLMGLSYVMAPKDNTKESGITNPNANGFYSEPENSIDIAVIGNSDAYSGFSPMELWNSFGYTSSSSSSSGSDSGSSGGSGGEESHPYGMANMAGVGMVDMAEAVARCTALETGGSLAPEAMKAQGIAY